MEKFSDKLKEILDNFFAGPPKEKLGVKGYVQYKLIGPDGVVRQEGVSHNLVTSVGDMYLAQFIAQDITTNPKSSYATLGVGTAAVAKADVACTSAIAASSIGVSSLSRVTSFSGAGEWSRFTYYWAAGATTNGSIGEIGMWSGTGSFIAHAVISPNVNKTANDTLQVEWAWKFLGA